MKCFELWTRHHLGVKLSNMTYLKYTNGKKLHTTKNARFRLNELPKWSSQNLLNYYNFMGGKTIKRKAQQLSIGDGGGGGEMQSHNNNPTYDYHHNNNTIMVTNLEQQPCCRSIGTNGYTIKRHGPINECCKQARRQPTSTIFFAALFFSTSSFLDGPCGVGFPPDSSRRFFNAKRVWDSRNSQAVVSDAFAGISAA